MNADFKEAIAYNPSVTHITERDVALIARRGINQVMTMHAVVP